MCAAALTPFGWIKTTITAAFSRPFCPYQTFFLPVVWQPVAGLASEQAEPLEAGLVWRAAEPWAWLPAEVEVAEPSSPAAAERAFLPVAALRVLRPEARLAREWTSPLAGAVEGLPVSQRAEERACSPQAGQVLPWAQERASPSVQEPDSGLALRKARELVRADRQGPSDRRDFWSAPMLLEALQPRCGLAKA